MDRVNLTPEQLAARLHLKPQTLANWRCIGLGPRFIKFGKKVLYPIDEVEKWERANLHSASTVKVSP